MNEKDIKLFEACRSGNIEDAKKALGSFLFPECADVNTKNSNGDTPLILASLYGFCGAVIYAIGLMINIYLAIMGVLILSAGCFILGRKMCEGKCNE